jgi:steroid 5-alpha reductase family enzyme
MSFLGIYAIGFAVILTCMLLLWLLSLRLENSSIVDIFWGTGFVIANWVFFALTPDGFLPRKLLIGALVTIWGLRLSIHILQKN